MTSLACDNRINKTPGLEQLRNRPDLDLSRADRPGVSGLGLVLGLVVRVSYKRTSIHCLYGLMYVVLTVRVSVRVRVGPDLNFLG